VEGKKESRKNLGKKIGGSVRDRVGLGLKGENWGEEKFQEGLGEKAVGVVDRQPPSQKRGGKGRNLGKKPKRGEKQKTSDKVSLKA